MDAPDAPRTRCVTLLIVPCILVVGLALAGCCPVCQTGWDGLGDLIQTPTPTPPPPTFTPVPTQGPLTLEGVSSPPEGKYLLVELGTIVDGEGKMPAIAIDFPGYRFDPEKGALEPFGPPLPPLPPQAWGYLGSGTGRRGDAGMGAASSLTVIDSVPYQAEVGVFTGAVRPDGFEGTRVVPVVLERVAEDGTLAALIDGERSILAPGGRWERVVEADVKQDDIDGHYVVTSFVVNNGWRARDSTSRGPE